MKGEDKKNIKDSCSGCRFCENADIFLKNVMVHFL